MAVFQSRASSARNKQRDTVIKKLAKRGYTIAIPFDNLRAPGYIGTFNEKGQEIIVDDGECLKKTTKRKPGTVVLGKLTKSSKFFSFLPTSPTQVSNGIDIVSLFVRK